MPLVHNNNTSVYSGVSRQAIDLRLPSHCEEMINCYPTIQNGVRRRNGTVQMSNSIIVEKDQFQYSYDRGLSGETEEQYVVTIDNTNGLRVFDVGANTYRTVTYDGNSADYLINSNPEVGFSAITVKDTTFIANKDTTPLMVGGLASSVNYGNIPFNTAGYSKIGTTKTSLDLLLNKNYTNLAPALIKTYEWGLLVGDYYAHSSAGATFTITIDGADVVYTVNVKNDGYNIMPETTYEMRNNIKNLIESKLDGYSVSIATDGSLNVYRLDGAATVISTAISFPTSVPVIPPIIRQIVYFSYLSTTENGTTPFGTVTYSSESKVVPTASNWDASGYVWIRQVSVDTAFPYTFYITLKDPDGTTLGSYNTNATSTTGVASAIGTWANGLAGVTASSSGSVVKITRDGNADFEIIMSDTYGNQASYAWKGIVEAVDDLPRSFPFKDTIVKVDGIQKADDVAYWLKYDGNKWIEHRDPDALWEVDGSTMPHKLVRNADYTFTLSQIDWNDMLVGDENTQAIPEFFGNNIKDLFFVNGRLGMLTSNGISLSQQGDIYNFFRTTVLALPSDSAISTYVDSSKSVGLEYAVELQGNVVLFGDKLQFALDTSKPITPATISVQPISGFEINKNVKPISSGDSIFFLVSKSGYSSLMEMNRSTLSNNIRAIDVSAHVPDYIDNDIMQIVSSVRDNIVVLRSRSATDTLYVYKHYGTETEKQQMAWSKWVFSMDIKSVFVFDKELYILGERYDSTVPIEDFSLATVWDDSKEWVDVTYWVDTDIVKNPSFERMDIDAYNVDGTFLDVDTVTYTSEIELSEWSINDKAGVKEMRGSLLIKTAEISSEDGSNFSLVVEDIERGTLREIPSQYTVDRKPFISGNAKNMRIKVKSIDGDGFQVNAISLEGQYNVRSKRV